MGADATPFVDEYAKYMRDVLRPTQDELRRSLDDWREPLFWAKYNTKSRMPAPSPIQRVHTRIKRPESVIDKIYRRPDSFPEGLTPPSLRSMHDALGARVVVYFLANLAMVDHEIRNHGGFEISAEVPPVAYVAAGMTLPLSGLRHEVKESGYASVHYLLRLRDSAVPAEDRPWFELQLRTMVEDVWGEIEHVLGYKPAKRTSLAVRKQFKILSSLLRTVDEHFNFVFEELSRFQEEVRYRDTDPLNAENLPPVLSDVSIGCSQREIDPLLKILASRNVLLVGDLQRLATVRNLDIIKFVHRSEEGREARNFDVVASLAGISDLSLDAPEAQLIERIKSLLAFLRAWDMFKRAEREE